MPAIKPPTLDDRRWQEIRDGLVEAIPSHAPEWTDRSPSDPGVAILEVFAFMAQNLLYRMNRVPDAAQRQFLDLMHVGLRPASPSTTRVRLALQDGAVAPFESNPGDAPLRLSAGDVHFEATGPISVLPVEGRPYIKSPSNAGLAEDDADVRRLLDDAGVDDPLGVSLAAYETRPLPEPEAGRVPESQALAGTSDRMLWVALLAPDPAQVDVVRDALRGRILHVGVIVDDLVDETELPWSCPAPVSPGRSPLPIRWQVLQARAAGADAVRPRYTRLSIDGEDPTAALTRSGVVRLRLPPESRPADMGLWFRSGGADPDDPDFEGLGDLPPLLDDVDVAERLVTWIRVFRPDDGSAELPHPEIRWIGVNVVEVEQAVTVSGEVLGRGSGRPMQQLRLANGQVLPASLQIETLEGDGDRRRTERWTRVDDFYRSGPADRHVMLDAATGTLTFGDGLRGRMPRPGEVVRAARYRHGGGAEGNLAAGAISEVEDLAGQLQVEQPFDARHGRDAETLEAARVRLPALLRHNDRAVAKQDFEDVALETPGARVGRVIVWPRQHPDEPGEELAGLVSLIIIPAFDPVHPDEPVPDREMLRRVCAHLEPRRLVTTELYLTRPDYVRIWISVAIQTAEGYSQAQVARWVELAIRQFLAPLPPYGPRGSGWPAQRDVTDRDVLASILQVEGVRLANQVVLSTVDGPATTVNMSPWQLPSVRKVQVVEGEVAEPIAVDEDPVRPEGVGADLGIHVPLVREVC